MKAKKGFYRWTGDSIKQTIQLRDKAMFEITEVKLLAHRAGLPGKVILFHIVPLDPAYKAGLAGHAPVIKGLNREKKQ